MGAKDLQDVGEIESQTLTPWSSASLLQELQVVKGVRSVAETDDQRVVGWYACRLIWPEAELLKIAVTKNKRGQGVGTALLRYLLADLQRQSFTALFLEVRSRNKPALAFYNRHCFKQVGRRRGYYSDPQDDALLLRKDI